MTKRIQTLLIANRGEIARRIGRTAHNMGMTTVAIYADGDVGAPFVKEADIALALSGNSSAETYLDIDKVLAAAKRAGADAIHPGYGFLSENAAFARAVVEAGLIWVGPSPDAIEVMGDKLKSKSLMQSAGVPTLPAQEVKPGENIESAANDIGYPILIKASAGGGGKGMRIVESATDLNDAVEGARREAGASFGDDTVFIERYVPNSRHVEVQVLGDSLGNLVHCFERECSVQRRHQKVIEEAPSPAVSDDLRNRMCEAALAAAKSVDYTSAGTVEFLLVGDEFWFLEMNTRLQVEHPVTEEITGLDLVREQLLVAQGETLSVAQSGIAAKGHAIEVRLYAEDPANDFLPQTGEIIAWEPSQSADARFDSGIESGSLVGIEFDPMLAKVIVHAPTRPEAALRLAKVLETSKLLGLRNNRDFLVAALRHPDFLDGKTTTDFIERLKLPGQRIPAREEIVEAAICAALLRQRKNREQAKILSTFPSGFRNTPLPPEKLHLRYGEEEVLVAYRRKRDGSFVVTCDEQQHEATIEDAGENTISVSIDGKRVGADVFKSEKQWLIATPFGDYAFTEIPRFPEKDESQTKGGLVAPMPGKVISVHTKPGDEVQAGDLLIILEAMKMEHRISAPEAGTVREVRVSVGDQVANDALLAVIGGEED